MRHRIVVGVVLVGLAAQSGLAAADSKVKACSLLTEEDIAGALAGKAGEGHPTDMQRSSGPQKGQTLYGCMWKVGAQDMLSVTVMAAMTGAAREAGLAKMRQGFETLRQKGWTEEKQTFGGGVCLTMTPPASEPKAGGHTPLMAGCMGEAKGMAISVGTMSPTTKYALAKIKALYDKVVSRLP